VPFGSKLLQILDLLGQKVGENLSGRTLAQLPEQSILRYLGEAECDLGMALQFLERSVTQMKVTERDRSEEAGQSETKANSKPENQKRKAGDDREFEHALDVIERFLSSLRKKRIKE